MRPLRSSAPQITLEFVLGSEGAAGWLAGVGGPRPWAHPGEVKGARSQVRIHVQALPAVLAKPARVLRGWHTRAGWERGTSPLHPAFSPPKGGRLLRASSRGAEAPREGKGQQLLPRRGPSPSRLALVWAA